MIKKIVYLLLLTLVLASTSTSQTKDSTDVKSGFDLQKISEGVYAAIRREPHGLTTNANSVFIINDHDVIVVDTTLTPGSASELLTALRKLTNKPVSYVINTHWHDDHILGNNVFREAFPRAEFVGHRSLVDYLPTIGLSNRKQALAPTGYLAFIENLRARLSRNESVFGGPMEPEERATYASDIEIGESYVKQNAAVPVVLPTLTIDERLTLYRGKRKIDIRYLGRGHTSGDIVVHLPEEKILIAGDLIIWPVPYVGSPQSHPGEWAETINKLVALNCDKIIPGHGPVLRDESYLKLMVQLLGSINEQVKAAVARRETLEQTRKAIDLSQFEEIFTSRSRMRKLVFRNYVFGAAIEAAFLDTNEKRSRGQD